MEGVEVHMRTREIALTFAVGAVIAVGCGGGSSSGTDGGGGKDVTTPIDSPADAGKDTTVVPEEAGEEASMMDGPTDGGGCAAVKMTDCEKCCDKAHPKGHKAHTDEQLTCACATATLCGPLEGGKGFDSGALDEGACKDSCGTTNPPDSHCDTCLDKATGTKKTPGACYKAVDTACTADPDCVTYRKCLGSCGG
jgi:hypothetical protein